MHKCVIIRTILHNVIAITASILPQIAECNETNKINKMHITYGKQHCTNAFILTSKLLNVNAMTASILQQNA